LKYISLIDEYMLACSQPNNQSITDSSTNIQ